MKQKKTEEYLVAKIEQAFRGKKDSALVLPPGDDAALWSSRPDYEAVLTCDWFLEGSHFLRDKHPADAVGWKCLARAASDIAAMGGQPRCFLLSLALPVGLAEIWLDQFLRGLRRAAQSLRCELAGGDTTKRKEVLINITVIGEVRRRDAIRRSGAQAGDLLFVSGMLGEADFGLRQLRATRGMAKPLNTALRKHLYPQPRIELGQWLSKNHLASAMMDISDGLSTDLPRLCAASGVGAKIEASSLPAVSLANKQEARNLALHGGDDYELLFTVRKKDVRRLPKRFRELKLTQIGEITVRKNLIVQTDGEERPLEPRGWDPFRN